MDAMRFWKTTPADGRPSLERRGARTVVAVLALAGWIATGQFAAVAAVPVGINYQGRLLDEFGHPVANGNYPAMFKICSAPVGGELCTNLQTISTYTGVFNVVIGHQYGTWMPAGSTVASFFTGSGADVRYLDVSVQLTPGLWTTLAPRKQFQAVPYALLAGDASTALGNLTVHGSMTVNGNVQGVAMNAWQLNGLQPGNYAGPVKATFNGYVYPWLVSTPNAWNQGHFDPGVSGGRIPLSLSGQRVVMSATQPLFGEALNTNLGLSVYGSVSLMGYGQSPQLGTPEKARTDGLLSLFGGQSDHANVQIWDASSNLVMTVPLQANMLVTLPVPKNYSWQINNATNFPWNNSLRTWQPMGMDTDM